MSRRQHHRHVYAGVLVLGQAVDAAELKLRRGRHTVVTDHEGADIERKRDPLARAWLERGDRAIVAAADLDDDRIAVVEVTRVYADGATLEVFRTCGELAPGDVFIMRGPKPRDSRPVIRRATVQETKSAANPNAAALESKCAANPNEAHLPKSANSRVESGVDRRPGATLADLIRRKRLALVEERTKSPESSHSGDLNPSGEITNRLGVLAHQAKTSTERGGGSQ